jgi:predicted GIY-YIG superfamily endonuclease
MIYHYVYILLSVDNKTYIACTNNLRDRIKRHYYEEVEATKNRLPLRLIAYFAFSNKYTAYDFEKYLKSGSGRAFIKKHNLVGKD